MIVNVDIFRPAVVTDNGACEILVFIGIKHTLKVTVNSLKLTVIWAGQPIVGVINRHDPMFGTVRTRTVVDITVTAAATGHCWNEKGSQLERTIGNALSAVLTELQKSWPEDVPIGDLRSIKVSAWSPASIREPVFYLSVARVAKMYHTV